MRPQIKRFLAPHLGCGGRVVQRVALPGRALLKLDKQPVCDPGQLLRAERVKEDGLIQAPHQLGAEKLLSLLDGLLAWLSERNRLYFCWNRNRLDS